MVSTGRYEASGAAHELHLLDGSLDSSRDKHPPRRIGKTRKDFWVKS